MSKGGSSFVPCPACGKRVAALLLDFHLFSNACGRGTGDTASPSQAQGPEPRTKHRRAGPEHAPPEHLTERSTEGPASGNQRQGPRPEGPLQCAGRSEPEAHGQERAAKKKRQDGPGGRDGERGGGEGDGASPDEDSALGIPRGEGEGASPDEDSALGIPRGEGEGEQEAPGAAPRPLMALFRRPSKTLWLIRHGHTALLDPLRPPGAARVAPAAGLGSWGAPGHAPLLKAAGGGRSVDVPLSALGAQQARALHSRFLGLAAEAGVVLVSPLTRALQTLCLALQGPPPALRDGACSCRGRTTPDAGSARDSVDADAAEPLSCAVGEPEEGDGIGGAHTAPPADVKQGLGPAGAPGQAQGQRWRQCPLREQVLREAVFRVVPGAVEHVAFASDVPRPVQEVQQEFQYTWLDFSQVPPALGATVEGFLGRESRDSLRRRVALFRDYVLSLPHAKVVVVGHSTFFMELTGSRKRMAHCQVATLRI